MYKTSSDIADTVLQKLAMRREMKEIAKDHLSPEDIQRVVENNRGMRHERLIKSLGAGSTAHGDKVMHPKHGIVARKRLAYQPAVPVSRIPMYDDIAIYNEIKKLQDKMGPSGWAKVHEVDPKTGLIFQEMVEGPSLRDERIQSNPQLAADERHAKRELKRFEKARRGGKFDKAVRINDDFIRWEASKNYIRRYRHEMRDVPDIKLSKEQQRLLSELKKTYPLAWDYGAGQNLIRDSKGNLKIIDAGAMFQVDKGPPKEYRPSRLTPGGQYEQFRVRAADVPKKKPASNIPVWMKRYLTPRNVGIGLGTGLLGYGAYAALRQHPEDREQKA
jgi:hypothetical protein